MLDEVLAESKTDVQEDAGDVEVDEVYRDEDVDFDAEYEREQAEMAAEEALAKEEAKEEEAIVIEKTDLKEDPVSEVNPVTKRPYGETFLMDSSAEDDPRAPPKGNLTASSMKTTDLQQADDDAGEVEEDLIGNLIAGEVEVEEETEEADVVGDDLIGNVIA